MPWSSTQANQLAASGSPTPAVTLTTPAGGGWGIAFDGAGDLWLANYSNANTVEEYTPRTTDDIGKSDSGGDTLGFRAQ